MVIYYDDELTYYYEKSDREGPSDGEQKGGEAFTEDAIASFEGDWHGWCEVNYGTGAFEEDRDARQAAINRGIPCVYETFDALLADPAVEAVALGGCYADRGGMAIKALQAGKHVIADKPLCTIPELIKAAIFLSPQLKFKVENTIFSHSALI